MKVDNATVIRVVNNESTGNMLDGYDIKKTETIVMILIKGKELPIEKFIMEL